LLDGVLAVGQMALGGKTDGCGLDGGGGATDASGTRDNGLRRGR